MTADVEIIPKSPKRQRKFKRELCDEVIRLAANGKSISGFCALYGVSHTTYYKWKKNFEEFREATEIAEAAYESYWVEMATKAAFKEFDCNPRLIEKMLDYASGKGGKLNASAPITIENLNVGGELPKELRQEKLKELLEKFKTGSNVACGGQDSLPSSDQ